MRSWFLVTFIEDLRMFVCVYFQIVEYDIVEREVSYIVGISLCFGLQNLLNDYSKIIYQFQERWDCYLVLQIEDFEGQSFIINRIG